MTTRTFPIGHKAQLSKTITERDLDLMAEVTGDTNPVHMDEAFAQKTRFQGRIAHGMLSVGLISAVLGTQLPGPGGIYLTQNVRFMRPVRIGDTITAEVEVRAWDAEKRILNLFTHCFNQDGKDVVKGEATILVEAVAAS